MLFCSHCGARIPENASFCYKCGTKVVIPEWDTEFRHEDEIKEGGSGLQAAPVPADTEHPAQADLNYSDTAAGTENPVTVQSSVEVGDDSVPTAPAAEKETGETEKDLPEETPVSAPSEEIKGEQTGTESFTETASQSDEPAVTDAVSEALQETEESVSAEGQAEMDLQTENAYEPETAPADATENGDTGTVVQEPEKEDRNESVTEDDTHDVAGNDAAEDETAVTHHEAEAAEDLPVPENDETVSDSCVTGPEHVEEPEEVAAEEALEVTEIPAEETEGPASGTPVTEPEHAEKSKEAAEGEGPETAEAAMAEEGLEYESSITEDEHAELPQNDETPDTVNAVELQKVDEVSEVTPAAPAETEHEDHFGEDDLLRVLEELRPRNNTEDAMSCTPGSDLTAEVESIRRLFSEMDMAEDSLTAIGSSGQGMMPAQMTAAEETVTEEPIAEETLTDELTAEETSIEEPAAEETAVEESEAEEPAVEETVIGEPAAEETAVEEPAAEEAAVQEPAAEDTAVEETAIEETSDEEPTAEEKAAEATAEDEAGNAIPSVNYLHAARKERFVPNYLAAASRTAEPEKEEEPKEESEEEPIQYGREEEKHPSDSLAETEALLQKAYATLMLDEARVPQMPKTLTEEITKETDAETEKEIPRSDVGLPENEAAEETENTAEGITVGSEPETAGDEDTVIAEENADVITEETAAVQEGPAAEVVSEEKGAGEEEDIISSVKTDSPSTSEPIKVNQGMEDKKAADRKRKGSLIAFLAIAAAIAGFLWYYLSLPENVYTRHLRRADKAAQQGDIAAAAAEYNLALEIRPDSPIASDKLREYWNVVSTEADDLAQRSQFEQALEKAKLLKQINPEKAGDAAIVVERILSAWASAAVVGGNENDVDQVLTIARTELSESGYDRIAAVVRDTRARISYSGYFTRMGDRCLELNAAEDRSYILSLMDEMVTDIAEYAAQGGTFPVRTGSNPLGAEAAFYYEEGNALQIYIGEFDEYGERTGTAASYVMLYSGDRREYWYYTCGWRWNQPHGNFSASCYGSSPADGVDYVTDGQLVDGLFEGQRTITPDGEDTFYLTYTSGHPELLEEEESDGTIDVVGYTSDRWDWIGMDDEAVKDRTGLPYVY
ncbi:MAG: zinc-ribbon domain-containing protein [Oscillospiraceae bacterium]|nr:zinc-ribbon domain-containing protein [Oscillospiraceae bacterium]